ncbi:PBP1A family penicillin-binding protein [candidate division WOR-3 bacterium]|nr:PBP1A family penicillin-binding protein [candidate division WOR-3 bacterium]
MIPIIFCIAGTVLGSVLRFRFLEDSIKDQLPLVNTLENPASGVTRIYDRNNKLIAEFSTQWRDPVPLESIPEYLVKAIITVEDRRFYEHKGISWFDIARAFIKDIVSSENVSGASTITQQLARNRFLGFEKSMQRKLKEFFLAREIERNFSKNEILELYLNEIYFGQGAYGVKAAAKRYFNKDLSELTLAECALIAGIPRQHNYYNPIRNYNASLERRNLILKMMKDLGQIDEETYNAAKRESLLVNEGYLLGGKAQYFVEEVRKWLISHYGIERIYQKNGGLDVYTTLDLDVQIAAESILEINLDNLEKTYSLRPKRLDENSIDETGKTKYIQGALVCIQAGTGEVLAIVGGRDFEESEFNRATQARRQVGSSFKPFVYLAAIDNGFTLGDVMLDAPLAIDLGGGKQYRPQNYDLKYEGFMTLRTALAKSRNVIAVKLLRHVGASTVISYARLLGIKSQLKPVLSLALGTCDLTLMEMTSAFSVFASGGMRADPYMIRKIEERSGDTRNIIFEYTPKPTRVISKTTAYLMQSAMRSVVRSGTATSAARNAGLTRPSAGKTGTTDDYTNCWMVGYTPDISCGVWVGYDSLRTIFRSASGGLVAAPIWASFIVEASRILKIPSNDFIAPENIVSLTVCTESGKIASSNCENTYSEIFIIGTEPTEVCPLHRDYLGMPEDPEFKDDTTKPILIF